MDREIKIPWVGGSIYHGNGVRYTMGRGAKIPWIEGSKYHGYNSNSVITVIM